MDTLLEVLAALGPAIAGLLTVPVLGGIKRLVSAIDRAPATLQQLLGVLIAFGLTQLGALLDVTLPAGLQLFDGTSTEALIAAAIAFAAHAGKKASEAEPRLQPR